MGCSLHGEVAAKVIYKTLEHVTWNMLPSLDMKRNTRLALSVEFLRISKMFQLSMLFMRMA